MTGLGISLGVIKMEGIATHHAGMSWCRQWHFRLRPRRVVMAGLCDWSVISSGVIMYQPSSPRRQPGFGVEGKEAGVLGEV